MPTRKIPMNYRNITGVSAHSKGQGEVCYESSLERDFLTLLDFRPDVAEVEVQPFQIPWVDQSGKRHTYTPDVLARYEETVARAPTVFEVKYTEEARSKWGELKPKFQAASAFAREHGWEFRLVTDWCIRTPFLKNAKFLLPFVRRGPVSEEHMNILDEVLANLGTTTVDGLLKAVFKDEWHRAELLPTFWYLLGSFQIGFNYEEPVTMSSQIWQIPDALWAESLVDRYKLALRGPNRMYQPVVNP
jgi:hypothetical protein